MLKLANEVLKMNSNLIAPQILLILAEVLYLHRK